MDQARDQQPARALDAGDPRRTKVVGAFSDGQSCLNPAAARLRPIAGTQWSTRRYMSMGPLNELELQTTGAAVAREKVRKILDTDSTRAGKPFLVARKPNFNLGCLHSGRTQRVPEHRRFS